jgi:hypothetical protein
MRRKVEAELERRGLLARMRAVNQFVKESALFWKILKARLAAIEIAYDIKDMTIVRDEATAVLRELGIDYTGLQLKPIWNPPKLFFIAAPTMEVATEVAAAVRAPRAAAPAAEVTTSG